MLHAGPPPAFVSLNPATAMHAVSATVPVSEPTPVEVSAAAASAASASQDDVMAGDVMLLHP